MAGQKAPTKTIVGQKPSNPQQITKKETKDPY
jgi:hypothetical protein